MIQSRRHTILSTLTFQQSYLRSNHHERTEYWLSVPLVKYFHPYKIVLAIVFCLAGARPGYAPNIYWQMWAIDASGNGADGVHTGDINRDGLIDVVSGWEQSGDLMLYLNPGPESVRQTAAWSRVDISGGVSIKGIEDAAFADLDLDGFDDAVLSSIEGDTQTLGIHWLAGKNLENPADWRGFNLAPSKHAGYMKARAAQIDGVRWRRHRCRHQGDGWQRGRYFLVQGTAGGYLPALRDSGSVFTWVRLM